MNFTKIKITIIVLIIVSLASVNAKQVERVNSVELIPRVIPNKINNIQISQNAKISRVILKFNDSYDVRLRNNKLVSFNNHSVTRADKYLQTYIDNSFRRLFRNIPEKQLTKHKEIYQYKAKEELANLNSYYTIETQSIAEATQIIEYLNSLESVEIAYIEPIVIPAGDIAPPTPDYVASQLYLNPAPDGVDALYAHTLLGGDGSGITIVDIEGNWQTTHEDLDKASTGFLVGDVIDDQSWLDHGTAVLGVMVGSDNGYGITGIAPAADIGMVSIGSMSPAEAIYNAIDSLEPGDIIIIELQSPGPLHNFAFRFDQEGFICLEYWQANFDAIKYAWAKGIIVVEVAGNGADDLDNQAVYGEVFDRSYRNSHAIIVGAGSPASSANDLERESFSNYGQRIDLQGYGSGVYTTGYGDLFDGSGDLDQYYTVNFGGTSAAAPIIAGTVASLQGYMKAQFGPVLNSDYIRDILYETGTAQLGNTLEHIGPRPNLDSAINAISAPPSLFSNPIYIDTNITEGNSFTVDLWLHNYSMVDNISFFIFDKDTTAKAAVPNWLEVSKQSGGVLPNDSTYIGVILDATSLTNRSTKYQGLLEIIWGHGAASLDSFHYLPVYLDIPCTDSSFSAISSDEFGGPVYNWISAKDSGLRIDTSLYYNPGESTPFDDGSAGPFAIGFDFPFFTNYYDSFYVGINGALSFTDSLLNVNGSFESLTIPGLPFNSFLTPFWNDLKLDNDSLPDAGIYIYHNTTLDTTVIEWYKIVDFGNQDDTLINFEIILSKDGNIIFQYNSVGNAGLENTALLGISEIDCNSLGYFNSGDTTELTPHDGEAILFKNHFHYGQTGNVNGIDVIDISDLVWFVSFMFSGGPEPVPYDAADINCSGTADISDLVLLVSYMFSDGSEPCEKWMYTGNI